MIIKRVLNKNAVIANSNKKGLDILLLGKGIAFLKKAGDSVDPSGIEKRFFLKNKDNMNRFTELFINVPIEIVYVSEKIINLGKIKLGNSFDEIIYINLTDHLNSSIERKKENIELKNPLKWEIAKYYPEEYSVGKQALEIVKEQLNIELAKDEASFIALHFVNANLENNFKETLKITEIISQIEKIVKDFFNTELDQESIDYYRFISHIKLFSHRLLEKQYYNDTDDVELLELIKEKYSREYECTLEIFDYITTNFDYELSSSELLYLTVHIRRLTKNLK